MDQRKGGNALLASVTPRTARGTRASVTSMVSGKGMGIQKDMGTFGSMEEEEEERDVGGDESGDEDVLNTMGV